MTEIAMPREPERRGFWLAAALVAAFVFALFYLGAGRQVARSAGNEVPLKPCKSCSMGCSCPKTLGQVRCMCPE